MPLNFGPCKDHDWTTSVERIDPLKGYTKDNVCLVAYEFNTPDFTCINKYRLGNGSSAWSHDKFDYFRKVYSENQSSHVIDIFSTESHTEKIKLVMKKKKKIKITIKSE